MFLGLILTNAALADQCSYVIPNQALATIDLIKPGAYVMDYCEPCRNGQQKIFEVKTISTQMIQAPNYYQVYINSQPVDLAYLFLQTKSQMADDDVAIFTNVSKMVGCNSQNVSSFLEHHEKTDR